MADVISLGESSAQQGLANAQEQGSAIASGAPIKAGMQLAGLQNDVEMQKQKLEEQKTQVQNAKFGQVSTLMDRLMKETDPKARKNLADALDTTSQRLGLGTISDMAKHQLTSDDETRNAYMTVSRNPMFQQVFKDPKAQEDYFKALYDTMGPKDGLLQAQSMFEKASQQKSAQDVAHITAQGKVEAAEMTGGARMENSARAEFKRFTDDTNLKPLIQAHQQASKDLSLLKSTIASGKGMPIQVLDELAAGMGNLVTNGKSALTDRQAQQMQNLQTKAVEKLGKYKSSGIATVNDPELFKAIEEQFERLKDATESNAANRLESLKRPTKNAYMAEQQDAAMKQVKDMFKQNNENSAAAGQVDHSADVVKAKQRGASQAQIEKAIGRPMSPKEMQVFTGQAGR